MSHGVEVERRSRPRVASARVLTLAELEAIRLILRGGSVVDWFRLNFRDEGEIEAFLRVLAAEPENPSDLAYLRILRDVSHAYLVDEHHYRVPDEIAAAEPIELFAFASGLKGRRRARFFACLTLKVMHIVHHIRARELRYRLPLSLSELAQLLISRVERFVKELEDEGFPIVEFKGGEKSESSLITKLLVKREHHAAAIHDRIRFRFVVERPGDLIPLLHRMNQTLLPFNYIVPGQSLNHLVSFTALVESHQAYREMVSQLQLELGYEEANGTGVNEFSGPSYHVISFVADLPIRVPPMVVAADPELRELGPILFGLAEFQIVDEETARDNELGENRHDRYRERQLSRTRERLERGLRGVPPDALDRENGS